MPDDTSLVLSGKDEREREAQALAFSPAGKTERADDAGDAALDAVVAGGVLDDLHAFDIAGSHHRKPHRHLAGKLRLETKRGLVAAVDLREVLSDLLANHERVDLAVGTRVARTAHAQHGDRDQE